MLIVLKTLGAYFVRKARDHTPILCPKHIESICDRCKTYKKAKKTTTGNVCYFNGTDGSSHLLPVIKLRLGGHSDSSKDFNFLLNTGSERSYLAQEAASTITINPKMVSIVDYRIRTFTGSG